MSRIAVAVVVAAIAGTLANAVAAGIWLGADKFSLALVPGRYGVAILCTALIPLLAARLAALPFFLVSVLVLTLLASLIAKFAFGAGAPWFTVIALNAVFAVATWGTYMWLSEKLASGRGRIT